MNLKTHIRDIPDFPKKGILFKDLTTLFKHPEAFNKTIQRLSDRYSSYDFDTVVGIESRGFILGAALAYALGKGFVPLRKPGKLPGKVASVSYELEYGEDQLEIHVDALEKGARVLLVDDILATGGTALGGANLIQKLGGEIVECCFIATLKSLPGEQRLKERGLDFFGLINF
ncbi:MAG: adenine phosphoribosyltransferase [Epsilonproteobacteria bacterium]|nr:MAG: adenine phosphoribosyltransferase [Campylobacterota bacterium]RLA66444.1 MAG: adenine phosphoribosyltransferase [Campylobacterota bacterium]